MVFEHGPFDYEQECRTVENKVETAMRDFDYAANGCVLDTATPGRMTYFYFVPGQYSSDNAIGVSILAAREAGLWLM